MHVKKIVFVLKMIFNRQPGVDVELLSSGDGVSQLWRAESSSHCSLIYNLFF